MINPLELVFQFFKAVDGEIGGDDREPGAGVNLGLEEISDAATAVVVLDQNTVVEAEAAFVPMRPVTPLLTDWMTWLSD